MKRLVAVALATAVLTAGAVPANAITNGQADGDGHPYVAALVAEYLNPGEKQQFCSGTLVAPRIVISAAHCLAVVEDSGHEADEIWVSFDPAYRVGISTIYHGTMVTAVDPDNFVGSAGYAGQYGNSTGGHDIAVVHLDEAPPITPAKLPPKGLLSSLDLRGQTFTAVGYGIIRHEKTKGPNNFDQNLDPSVRDVATQEFRSLQDFLLTLSQNPATGDGGWCFGDSGSTNFVGDSDVMASVSVLIDSACRATGRGYRLDTDFAREFLASQGVPLP
jgi:hypothetical protein